MSDRTPSFGSDMGRPRFGAHSPPMAAGGRPTRTRLPVACAAALAAAVLTASHTAWLVPLDSAASLVQRPPSATTGRFSMPAVLRRAQGFGDAPNPVEKVVYEAIEALEEQLIDSAKGAAQASAQEQADKGVVPVHKLAGPLMPPAAPATYKALLKMRLKKDPDLFSEVMLDKEIEQGAVFRAVAARECTEKPGTFFLKTDEEYGGSWIYDTGVAGKFANQRVVKRVAGSQSKRGMTTILEISMVDRADVFAPGQTIPEPDNRVASTADKELPIYALLEDDAVTSALLAAGLSAEDLRNNPEFIQKVARSIYGEEVVK